MGALQLSLLGLERNGQASPFKLFPRYLAKSLTYPAGEFQPCHLSSGAESLFLGFIKANLKAQALGLVRTFRRASESFMGSVAHAGSVRTKSGESKKETLTCPYLVRTVKSSNKVMTMDATGRVGGSYGKAFHAMMLNKEEYERHYHKRSNVESTFSAIKRKFGGELRSKTDRAMKNEALAKVVAHNITCVINAMYEHGLMPMIGCTNTENPAQILRIPGA